MKDEGKISTSLCVFSSFPVVCQTKTKQSETRPKNEQLCQILYSHCTYTDIHMHVYKFLCIYECICIILYESLHVPVTTPLLPTKYQTKLFLTHDILIFRTFAEKSMTNVGFSFVYHSIFFSSIFFSRHSLFRCIRYK